MDFICTCGRPIEEKDAGLCVACWKVLFEIDESEAPQALPANVIILETPILPF